MHPLSKFRTMLGTSALAVVFCTISISSATAVTQWARLYHMPCEGCHSTYPRLNATGLAFRQNCYRFTPNELAVINARTLSGYVGSTWSPSVNVSVGKSAAALANGFKTNLGGALGRSAAFLVQPTPGGTADYNMAQGMLNFGSRNDRFRLTGGRLYAWANGGGGGAADRYLTATNPRMLGTIHGISIGGLGNGMRLEYTHKSETTLALFLSDMEAEEVHSGVVGLALSRRLDAKSASSVELFAATGAVPVSGHNDASAARYGVFVNRAFQDGAGHERFNVLGGFMAGQESHTLIADLPGRFATGFVECDWSPQAALTCFAREDWENNAVVPGANTAFTVGAAVKLNRNLRLDTDYLVHTPGSSVSRLIGRLRILY